MNEELIQDILSSFVFNPLEITVLSLLFVFALIQIFFYLYYYKRPLSFAVKHDVPEVNEKPMVSVIISSENESDRLAENLPLILEQDYPNFEVIVVNNGSTDETDYLLQSLQLKYPHLYHTYVPTSYDKAFGRRKLAFTVGIKAAKGDVLLFVEPYGKPMSSVWISTMVAEMSRGKDVVLGYSFYKKTKAFFNRMARFDNHFFSMQYLSMAILKKPFTGVYRNVAFKRHLFFDHKGFASFLNLENGEDVFINQIVNDDNTAISTSPDSFVETTLSNFSLWKRIKKDYSVAQSCFKDKRNARFAVEYAMRYVFFALFVAAVVYSALLCQWGVLSVAIFILLFKLTLQLVVTHKVARYFMSGKFIFSFPLLSLLQPIYNLRFRTRSRRLSGRR